MTKLNMLALLGIVAALGMSGCGKKSPAKHERNDRGTQMRDHRKPAKKKKARKIVRRDMHREERNMFAK